MRRLFDDEETRERIGAGLKQQLAESERRIEWIKIDIGWDAVNSRRAAASDRENEARIALIETVPTTVAGCIALLDRLLSRDVFNDGSGDNEEEVDALESLRLALRHIAGEPAAV
ncbi:hypothetical protein WDZ92_28095 [Nostoc sp. NIES-2111]